MAPRARRTCPGDLLPMPPGLVTGRGQYIHVDAPPRTTGVRIRQGCEDDVEIPRARYLDRPAQGKADPRPLERVPDPSLCDKRERATLRRGEPSLDLEL